MKLTVRGREAYAYTGGKPFDAALPCVALVHGALHDHSVWALQSRYLAHHGCSVLAIDLPGHGRSAGPAPSSVEDGADWLLALLQAAGVARAALVGHSMGSLIVLEAASRTAGGEAACEITRLMMIATAFPMKVTQALFDAALAEPQAAIDRVNGFSHSTLAAKPANPGPGTWLHGAHRALMGRLQDSYASAGHGNLFHHDFGVCDRYAGGLEAAARVRCPSRLVLGSKDRMNAPQAAQGLANALHADVRLLAAGHALMAEAPDGVLNELKDFLR